MNEEQKERWEGIPQKEIIIIERILFEIELTEEAAKDRKSEERKQDSVFKAQTQRKQKE